MVYTTKFYDSTSKTLFLRLYQLDPPPKRHRSSAAGLVSSRRRWRRSLSSQESDALWLWRAHNNLNIQLYDNEIEAQVYSAQGNYKNASLSPNLCKGNLFPKVSVCPLCYRDPKTAEEFKSARTVLRYLYGVYTSEKII